MNRSGPESRDELAALNGNQGIADNDPFTVHRYRRFADRFSGSPRILDVGANTGRGGASLKASLPAARLYGLEMLPARVAQIPSGLYETPVRDELLEDHEGIEGGYDGIVMGELIEHIPWAGIDPLIFAAYRLLTPGGKLVLTTPNPHYVLLKLRSGGSVLGGPHVSVHCPNALKQYLQFRGFKVTELCGSGGVSRVIGHRFPLRMYGAYMVTAVRPLVSPG